MKLRKIFAAFAAAAMCMVGLTACSSGGENSDKVLKVGVKDSVIGFGYKDPLSGEYSGMEIELAKKLADELGYKDVEFTTVTAATRTELLDSGDLDCVLATFTITEERKKSWDFSTPYYTDAVTVLVETADGITNVDGLVGKKIGVSTGSTSAYNLAKTMSEKGLFGDYTVPESSADFDISSFNQAGTTFEQFGDYPAISNAMAAGTVDAFCVDKSILANFKTEERDYIEDTFAPQDYGVATRKDSELSAPIEELITKWLSDGTVDGLIAEFKLN
ncbi:MAG: transporter substrate-binding domain-containing protein [Lachnospiraceae bacterium]|nr:transporter substrate-binding domain-containing protein [Ruminococcus sp.]MCM1275906.1 transporter substrate-binding domain-containing protein [Lachnospiraceae bacterium]